MKRVLLLGSKGMLGQSLEKRFSTGDYTLFCQARQGADYNFDLLDTKALINCFEEVKPDIVINAAANVDLGSCENNPGDAYLINGKLCGTLAELCREQGSYLVHVSTDHFYCGDGDKKHKENDQVRLLNEYARSKYAGECFAGTYENALILRTNIVGFRGTGKPTFLEWAVNEIEQGNPMTLFSDYYTSSMHTEDFAKVLHDVIPLHPVGTYNLASRDVTSKRDFILALSKTLFGKYPSYQEGSVKNLQGVPRADSPGLDTEKIERLVGYKMPNLQETMISIKKEYDERKANASKQSTKNTAKAAVLNALKLNGRN